MRARFLFAFVFGQRGERFALFDVLFQDKIRFDRFCAEGEAGNEALIMPDLDHKAEPGAFAEKDDRAGFRRNDARAGQG